MRLLKLSYAVTELIDILAMKSGFFDKLTYPTCKAAVLVLSFPFIFKNF